MVANLEWEINLSRPGNQSFPGGKSILPGWEIKPFLVLRSRAACEAEDYSLLGRLRPVAGLWPN